MLSHLSTPHTTLPEHELRDMLRELRRDLFVWLPLPTAFVALYSILLLNRLQGVPPAWVVSIAGAVTLVSLAAHWLRPHHLHGAIYLYLAGLTVVAVLWLWHDFVTVASMALLFGLLLLAMNLVGNLYTLISTVLISVVLILSGWHHGQPFSSCTVPLGLLWLTYSVTWFTSRSLRTALEWSWNSFSQSVAATEEARQHRGQLMKTLKELDSAYARLERFSAQLAHARNAAEEARRAKQRFVANVSHELRTPLNIIIGFSETIVLSPESYGVGEVPRPFMGDVNRIYRSAQHLKKLIDDVLDLSKLDAQHLPLFMERTTLLDVITEATDMIEPLAAQKGLALRVEAPAELPSVMLDRLRVRQVLLNLLSNAVRFTERGGITVSCIEEDAALQVAVHDTGPGIPPENLSRVFEEFYQIDDAPTKRFDGTGLGLALSRRFITLHGGRMWVESEPGQGSCFCFTLPLAFDGRESTRRQHDGLFARPHWALSERTVLVASTDAMVSNFLKRHLQNYQVRSVDPTELDDAVASYLPHAVIAPGADTAVTAALSVPVIHCPLPDPTSLARTLGVEHYLVKPIAREQLLSLLARYGDAVQHVLIIDDDVQLCELLARTVRSAPGAYTIDIACGGEEGLAQMRERRPDLLFLDFMMPSLHGLAVLQQMRDDPHLRNVRVAMITAHDLPGEALAGENLQWTLDGCIEVQGVKGFTTSQTLRCLQGLLDALPPPTPVAVPPVAPHPIPATVRSSQPAS